jgi:hypothetical protein
VKNSILLFAAAIFLGIGCNSNKNQADAIVASPVDSFKLANKVYTEQLLSLSSEKNIGKLLCQAWELEDDIDVIKDNGEAQGVYPFRSFYFSVDSTFTKNPRNFMEYGKWSYNDTKKLITLTYSNGNKDEYKIAAIGSKELILINSGEESVTKLKFISAGKRYRDKTADPYYIDNNRWRIKPRFSETDEQVRKRLKACIHFYILFYSDNLAKEENVISFYGLPTCLTWYAGGIYMVKEKELADNWFECFYSKAQAMQAYTMMEDVIGKKYKWTKGNMSWVKKNLLVLEQMYANL